jgi:hypothetical protein
VQDDLSATAEARQAALRDLVRAACERAARAGYVQDCERVAEYLAAATPEARQDAIRLRFWSEYRSWSERHLLRVLEAGMGQRRAWQHRDAAPGLIYEKVFAPEPFRTVAAAHAPHEGKTFEQFLKQWVRWRAQDVLREELNPGANPVSAANPALHAAPAQPPARVQAMQAAVADGLYDCLSQLEAQPQRGPDQRAAYELRHLAYIEPMRMGTHTLELVRRTIGSTDPLFKEFEDARQEIQVLLKETLRGAKHDRDEAYATREERKEELRRLGRHLGEIDELEDEARARTLGSLKAEKEHLHGTPHDDLRRVELDFMMAVFRHERAARRLEEAKTREDAWDWTRLPWVRSQSDIERLTKIDQVTVSRLLQKAVRFLRDCLDGKGLAPR